MSLEMLNGDLRGLSDQSQLYFCLVWVTHVSALPSSWEVDGSPGLCLAY